MVSEISSSTFIPPNDFVTDLISTAAVTFQLLWRGLPRGKLIDGIRRDVHKFLLTHRAARKIAMRAERLPARIEVKMDLRLVWMVLDQLPFELVDFVVSVQHLPELRNNDVRIDKVVRARPHNPDIVDLDDSGNMDLVAGAGECGEDLDI